MFKNTTSNASKSRRQSSYEKQETIIKEKDWLRKKSSLTFYADSTNLDYTIQLWPKGKFTYSPDIGFTGEAEKVLITGKSKTGSASSGILTTEEIDKSKMSYVASARKEESITDQQKIKNSSPSWKFMLMAGGLILMGTWLGYIKITKVFELKT